MPTPPQPLLEVDVAQLALAQGAGAYILDVREPPEVAEYRIPGVVPIPMSAISSRLDEVPTDRTVYVVCAVGARSARVADYLRTNGIAAVNVAGGTDAWIVSGRAVERG